VNAGRLLWVAGAYFVGMIQASYLVARARGATTVLQRADRRASETDAHMLLRDHVGPFWMVLAATADVTKAGLYPLAARRFGDLPVAWVAFTGFVMVMGYAFPLVARTFAGRGLAAAAGVSLALLPVPMFIGGSLILLGLIARQTGPSTTIGFASIPVWAAIQGQPDALVAMAAGIFGIALLRRLEGVSLAARRWGWGRALARRLLLDADLPAAPRRFDQPEEDAPPA
jgi:glycerol-3-phosphate acyltransferase PlsY